MRFMVCGALLLGSLLSANRLLADMPPARKNSSNADPAVSKLLAAADDQLNNQRWDDAIASCTEVLRLQAGNFDAFSRRALAWSRKGEIDKALGDFESALKIKPASPVELVIRSGLYVKKRRFDLATRDLSAAIQFDPSFAVAYTMRGDLSLATKNYPRAIADFNEAIRLDPTVAQTYINRARAYKSDAGANSGPGARTAAEDYQAALADLRQAVKLAPKSAEACRDLAWLQATCPEASVRDGRSAVANALQPCELVAYKDAGCLETLAAAYAEAGDFDNAVTWQYGALELAPEATKAALRQRVNSYQQRQPYHEAPNPPPPDAIAIEKPAGWLLLHGKNQFSAASNFPDDVRNKLRELNAKGADIKCVSFSSRGWVVLFDKNDFFAANLPEGAEKALRDYQAKGSVLKQIAFTPQDGWVVLAGRNETTYDGLPTEVGKVLGHRTDSNAELKWIAFSPTGGWIVLYDRNDSVQRDIPDGMIRALERWRNEGADFSSAAFAPSGEWIILFNRNGAWTTIRDEALKAVIEVQKSGEPFKSMVFGRVAR